MPQIPSQETTGVPEELLSKKLDEDWLQNDPKPRRIEMTRRTDGAWNIKRDYD